MSSSSFKAPVGSEERTKGRVRKSVTFRLPLPVHDVTSTVNGVTYGAKQGAATTTTTTTTPMQCEDTRWRCPSPTSNAKRPIKESTIDHETESTSQATFFSMSTQFPFSPFLLSNNHHRTMSEAHAFDRFSLDNMEYLAALWLVLLQRELSAQQQQQHSLDPIQQLCVSTLSNLLLYRPAPCWTNPLTATRIRLQVQAAATATAHGAPSTCLPPWHVLPGMVLTLDYWFHMTFRRCKVRQAMAILGQQFDSDNSNSNSNSNNASNAFVHQCDLQTMQWLATIQPPPSQRPPPPPAGTPAPAPQGYPSRQGGSQFWTPVGSPTAPTLGETKQNGSTNISWTTCDMSPSLQSPQYIRRPRSGTMVDNPTSIHTTLSFSNHNFGAVIPALSYNASPDSSIAPQLASLRLSNAPTTVPVPAVALFNTCPQFASSRLANGSVVWQLGPTNGTAAPPETVRVPEMARAVAAVARDKDDDDNDNFESELLVHSSDDTSGPGKEGTNDDNGSGDPSNPTTQKDNSRIYVMEPNGWVPHGLVRLPPSLSPPQHQHQVCGVKMTTPPTTCQGPTAKPKGRLATPSPYSVLSCNEDIDSIPILDKSASNGQEQTVAESACSSYSNDLTMTQNPFALVLAAAAAAAAEDGSLRAVATVSTASRHKRPLHETEDSDEDEDEVTQLEMYAI